MISPPLTHTTSALTTNCVFLLQRWKELCETLKTAKWSKIDTKEGVTVARCKFGRNSKGHAVMKIEGVLPADPATVYQFLQLSMREGGKVCMCVCVCAMSVTFVMTVHSFSPHHYSWTTSLGMKTSLKNLKVCIYILTYPYHFSLTLLPPSLGSLTPSPSPSPHLFLSHPPSPLCHPLPDLSHLLSRPLSSPLPPLSLPPLPSVIPSPALFPIPSRALWHGDIQSLLATPTKDLHSRGGSHEALGTRLPHHGWKVWYVAEKS